jgi:nucleoid DNA-binding protein
MAELKTKETTESVTAFLDKIADKNRQKDCRAVIDLMREVTKEEPKMWGSAIVGFGRYHYKSQSGREGEWMLTGFSRRKGALTLYILGGLNSFSELNELGKYKSAKSCLYIKQLGDVDVNVLRKILKKSINLLADKRIRK